MQTTRALCASLLLATTAIWPAAAQMYPGGDVSVNAGAMGRGYLLYPGGKYGRQVGHLLQPGERPGAPVHLHWPARHRTAKTATPAPVHIASVPTVKPQPVSKPAPPVSTDLNALPEDSATRLVGTATTAAPAAKPVPLPAKPMRTAKTTPPPATIPFSFGNRTAPSAPPARTASITPPPVVTRPPPATVVAGMKKQSTVLFPVGESSPAAGDVSAIHALAGALNAALSAGATRIQLDAFGGPRGDKSSDSRRLSLKRALVVRELLIEDGVPSEKIDVRAMGGVDDSGVADRVDVFVRA